MVGGGSFRSRCTYCNPRVTVCPTHRWPVHESSQSGQQLDHPMARAPQPAGDLALTDPRAAPPAGPVAFGFECPGNSNQDDQQRRQHPQQGAGNGGRRFGGGRTNRGTQASPVSWKWCAGSLRLAHHNPCGSDQGWYDARAAGWFLLFRPVGLVVSEALGVIVRGFAFGAGSG